MFEGVSQEKERVSLIFFSNSGYFPVPPSLGLVAPPLEEPPPPASARASPRPPPPFFFPAQEKKKRARKQKEKILFRLEYSLCLLLVACCLLLVACCLLLVACCLLLVACCLLLVACCLLLVACLINHSKLRLVNFMSWKHKLRKCQEKNELFFVKVGYILNFHFSIFQ